MPKETGRRRPSALTMVKRGCNGGEREGERDRERRKKKEKKSKPSMSL